MKKTMLLAVLLILSAAAMGLKNQPAYEVGTFVATAAVSDGTYSNASCDAWGCSGSAYNAAHNIHQIETPEGIYMIEAPVSVGGTLALGMLTGNAPIVHKGWFMDDLHQGDKVLFSAQCNKHNNCAIHLPNPDNPDKVIKTQGFFKPTAAKTNTGVLCGTGKLAASVEAQVCNQANARAIPQPVSAQIATVQAPIQPQPAIQQVAAVSAQRTTEHPIEGYTISGPETGTGSGSGDQTSLGDAARAQKAKKQADQH